MLKLLFLQLTNKKGIYILIVFDIYHDDMHEVGNLVVCGIAEIDRLDPLPLRFVVILRRDAKCFTAELGERRYPRHI